MIFLVLVSREGLQKLQIPWKDGVFPDIVIYKKRAWHYVHKTRVDVVYSESSELSFWCPLSYTHIYIHDPEAG